MAAPKGKRGGRVSHNPLNPNSPDFDPYAAIAAGERRGETRGSRARATKARKELADPMGPVAKGTRRGYAAGGTDTDKRWRARLADPAGPVARGIRTGYRSGSSDTAESFAYFLSTGRLENPFAIQALRREAREGRAARREQREVAREQRFATREYQRGQAAERQGTVGAGFDRLMSQRVSAPSGRGVGVPGVLGRGMTAQTSQRAIVMMLGACGLAIVIQGRVQQSSPTTFKLPNGRNVLLSPHLRQYAALVIAGTVLLILAEFSPGFAFGLGLLLTIDIVVIRTNLFNSLAGVLGPNSPAALAGIGVPGMPTTTNPSQLVPWITANPCKWPNPGAGASDTGNQMAAAACAQAKGKMKGNP